jgi:hypothetical protein
MRIETGDGASNVIPNGVAEEVDILSDAYGNLHGDRRIRPLPTEDFNSADMLALLRRISTILQVGLNVDDDGSTDSISVADASTGRPGQIAPLTGVQVGGTDGTAYRTIVTDTSGHILDAATSTSGTAIPTYVQLVGGTNGGTLRPIAVGAAGDVIVQQATGATVWNIQGLTPEGAAPSSNPLQVSGWDGTDVHTFKTDTSGRIILGAPSANLPVNVTGASGATLDGATGAAVPTQGLLVLGSDGTDGRALSTDTSGRPSIVGAAADAAAVAGNPVLVGANDGTDVRSKRVATIFGSTEGTGTTTNIYVPGAGNKFRLFGFSVMVSGNATLGTAGAVLLKLLDGSGGTVIWQGRVWVLTTDTVGVVFNSGWIDLGDYGYLSSTAANDLTVSASSGLSTGTYVVNYAVGIN